MDKAPAGSTTMDSVLYNSKREEHTTPSGTNWTEGIKLLIISCVLFPGIPTAAPSTKGFKDLRGSMLLLSTASFIEGHP